MKRLPIKAFTEYHNIEGKLLNTFNVPIIVLMYHRVLSMKSFQQPYIVQTANFKKQINYLAKNFNIVKFDDDWSDLSCPSFVITFDDGYYDNYAIAKNFLVKKKIPSTFFVATNHIDRESLFWWDEIALHWSTYKNAGFKSIEKVSKTLVNSNLEEQEVFLSKFRPKYEKKDDMYKNYRGMTKKEILSLSQNDEITIGCHTTNHIKLPLLNKESKRIELSESKRYLEKIIGKKVEYLSYPFGYYDSETINICKNLGFKKICTTVEKNCYSWTNPMKIPRFQVHDENIISFKSKINKLIS